MTYKNMYALTDCQLYTGARQLTDHAVVINGGTIVAITPQVELDATMPQLSAQSYAAAPGFIDLQLNGCGGVMFNDAITAATLDTMHATNLKSGTTSYLPTLITTSDRAMETALDLVATYRRRDPNRVLGLHLEGPYLNPKRKGIHDDHYIRSAGVEMVKTIVSAGPEVVRLITLAPEMVDPRITQRLAKAGILVSAGHTDATFEEANAGFRNGVGMVTHLFNAMSPWQGRKPGMVGATFNSPEVYAGIIADGHHVHFGSIALAQKIKQDKLILVSDATPPVGTTLKSFVIGSQEVFYRDGKCVSAEGTLGGSALTLIEAVANCCRQLQLPLAEALRMASLYPARAIKVDHCLGLLAPNYIANIVLFDAETFSIKGVIDQGKLHPFDKSLIETAAKISSV